MCPAARRPGRGRKPNRIMQVASDRSSDGSEFDAQAWPFFWLTHANGLYLSRLERGLKRVDLDIPRWRVLMCIKPGTAKSVSEIAEKAIVKLPTMMKLIQRMEADGLVSCEARVSDGRVTDVSLTPAGLSAREMAWRSASKVMDHVFPDDMAQDIEQLNVLLRKVVARLKDD